MRSLLATAAIGALLSSGSAAAIANPYEDYEGTTIVVSWPALSHFQAAETLIEEFTEETGIEVEVDALQYLKLRDRQLLEMSKDEGEYDIVSWVVMWKGEYVSKGLLTPLSQFFTNGALVDPEYDIDDIADAYLQNGGVVGGKKGYMPGKSGALYGVPFGAETSILAYRKDIFEEHGIDVPTNYDELVAAMTAVKEKAGMGAMTSRGKTGHQVTAGWLLHLAPLGGKIFDDQWNPVINSPEGVKAAEVMRTITDTGPTGIPSYGFSEASAAFLQGDAAMYLDTLKIAAMSRNEKLSKVDGKVGFALHPVGSRCGSETGGFAMGIPANAPNKEAAFLFIQYMTSKAGDRRMVELGGDPIRLSTLQDPAFVEK
ncbi:MAG: ABC transporter substrate-binding protein, partial [Geminicoccaceae bacterium]